MGKTAEAQALFQYKGYAIPIFDATITNADDLAKLIKKEGVKKALESDAGKELFYSIGMGTVVGVLTYDYYQELAEKKDKTFLENAVYKGIRDAMSIFGAFDLRQWSAVRLIDFYHDLSTGLIDLMLLEKMKTTGELKGLRTLGRTITPSAYKQAKSIFFPEVAKKKKGRLRTGVKLR